MTCIDGTKPGPEAYDQHVTCISVLRFQFTVPWLKLNNDREKKNLFSERIATKKKAGF